MDLDGAEDIAAMDNAAEGLKQATENIVNYSAYGGLRMNAKRSECMVMRKENICRYHCGRQPSKAGY